MARKEKFTLDYFPHYAVQGDISKIIQAKYGNDGYAVLYKNYEHFCLKDRQYIDLKEFVTFAAISADCRVSEDKYLEIVDTLANLGAYDKELWEEHKIIISEKFIENTKDAYRKRTSECINFAELKNFFRQKSTNNGISDVGNQQIKLKETKEKENKKNIVVCIDEKTEIVSGNQTTTTKFLIPSLNDIKEYCDSRNGSIDAQKFFDYYEASGWMLKNGTPMQNWKAAVRTWERNEKKNGKTEIVSGNRECMKDAREITAEYKKVAKEVQEQKNKMTEKERKAFFKNVRDRNK